MQNIAEMILHSYEETESVKDHYYYAVKDNRSYPENLMIDINELSVFVEENGGLKEFDYYA
jgi:hypothetical protein